MIDGRALSLATHFFVGYSIVLSMIILRCPILLKNPRIPPELLSPFPWVLSLAFLKEFLDVNSYGVFDIGDIASTLLGAIVARLVFLIAQRLLSNISQELSQYHP